MTRLVQTHLRPRFWVGLGIGLLGLVALTAPGAGGAAHAAEAEVNIYSSRHYDADQAIYDLFTKETGIAVNVIEGKADELIERIKAEGRNSPADVLITVDAGNLWRAEQARILQKSTTPEVEAQVPAILRHPDGLWVAISKRMRVIMVDKAKIGPGAIPDYENLADPIWKGRLCVRSSTDVYNQSLIGSVIAADGIPATETWARGVVANLARAPWGGDIDLIKAVAAGQCQVTMANHYYLVRLMRSSDPRDRKAAERIGVILPNQNGRGVHTNISGVAIAAYAPHVEAARRFIAFLTAPEAQALVTKGNYEFPANPAVPVEEPLKAWASAKTDALNAGVFGANNADALKVADRAGWR